MVQLSSVLLIKHKMARIMPTKAPTLSPGCITSASQYNPKCVGGHEHVNPRLSFDEGLQVPPF